MRSGRQNATVPEEGKIHLTYSLFANLIEYIFSQKVEKIKETIGTANPGNSKEAVPEGGEIHRTYTLFAISGGVFAVQVPTRPPPQIRGTSCGTSSYTSRYTSRGVLPYGLPYTSASHPRMLHILVCFTHTFASLTRAAGRELGP